MPDKNGSTLEGKSKKELDRIKSRFQSIEGQNQGVSHMMDNQFINKVPGTFAYPVHIGEKKGN
jgi:hypothetical protein